LGRLTRGDAKKSANRVLALHLIAKPRGYTDIITILDFTLSNQRGYSLASLEDEKTSKDIYSRKEMSRWMLANEK
jgi:hypothetical protein